MDITAQARRCIVARAEEAASKGFAGMRKVSGALRPEVKVPGERAADGGARTDAFVAKGQLYFVQGKNVYAAGFLAELPELRGVNVYETAKKPRLEPAVSNVRVTGPGLPPTPAALAATLEARQEVKAELTYAEVRALERGKFAQAVMEFARQHAAQHTGGLAPAVEAYWVQAVSTGDIALDALPESVRNNLAVVAAALARAPWVYTLEHAGEALRDLTGLVRLVVALEGEALEHASERLRGDKETVLAAVTSAGEALQYASPAVAGDLDVVLAAVRDTPYCYRYSKEPAHSDATVIREFGVHAWSSLDDLPKAVVKRLLRDEQFVLEHVREHPRAFRELCKQYSDHDAIARAAVAGDPEMLEHVSARLKKDETLVLSAVSRNGRAWEHADPEVRARPNIVRAAIAEKENGWCAVHDVADDPKASALLVDRAFVMSAIPLNERVFWKAERFHEDREVVLHAMRHFGGLSFAPKFQGDPEVVRIAVEHNGKEIEHVSPSTPGFDALVKDALARNPYAVWEVPKKYLEDRAIALDVVKRAGSLLSSVSPRFASDPAFIKLAVESNNPPVDLFLSALKGHRAGVLILAQSTQEIFSDHYLAALLKGFENDREIMLGAVRQNPALWKKVGAKLATDRSFVLEALRANGEILNHVGASFQKDRECVLVALADAKLRLNDYDTKVDLSVLLADRSFALSVLEKNGARLRDLPANLQDDPDVVRVAARKAWRNIVFASERLQTDAAFLAELQRPA